MASSEKLSRDIARKRVHFISELLRLNLDYSISDQGTIRNRHVELARGQLEQIKALLSSYPELKFTQLEKCEARVVILEEMAGISTLAENQPLESAHQGAEERLTSDNS